MEESKSEYLFSEEVIDFVKTANEFCKLAENPFPFKKSELLGRLQSILPLLYCQFLKLPQVDSVYAETNEKFVTEEEYDMVQKGLAAKLGYLDDYLEIVEPDFSEADGPVSSKLSEDFADIFQDLKNFLSLFRVGNNDMMNDALWETNMNFGAYWGQKLVNALRVIHKILNSGDPVDEEEQDFDPNQDDSEPDTSSWFVAKRQEEYRNSDSINDK